jgi:hypothetical protein
LNKCSLWYIKEREIERKIENLSLKKFMLLHLNDAQGVEGVPLTLMQIQRHPFYASLNALYVPAAR